MHSPFFREADNGSNPLAKIPKPHNPKQLQWNSKPEINGAFEFQAAPEPIPTPVPNNPELSGSGCFLQQGLTAANATQGWFAIFSLTLALGVLVSLRRKNN